MGQRRLVEAVEAYRNALTVYTRDDLPQAWATIQNNLGLALAALGERQGGPVGLQRLVEAVEAYRNALTVATRDDLPQPWARTQGNLGRALQILVRLGGFPAGLDQVDRLVQAEGIRDDPVAQASLRTLAIVGQFATHQDAEASRACAPGRPRRTPAGRLPPRLGLDAPARAPGAIGRPAHPGPSRGPGEAPRRSQSGK